MVSALGFLAKYKAQTNPSGDKASIELRVLWPAAGVEGGEEVVKVIEGSLNPFFSHHLWNTHGPDVSLHLSEDSRNSSPFHVVDITLPDDDCSPDVWMLVGWLRGFSEKYPGCWGQVRCSAGELLLIEAAELLPPGMDSDTSTRHRCWCHEGHWLYIPHGTVPGAGIEGVDGDDGVFDEEGEEEGERVTRGLSFQEAVEALATYPEVHSSWKLPGDVQDGINAAIVDPSSREDTLHHSRVVVVPNVAVMLRGSPWVVALAVEAVKSLSPRETRSLRSLSGLRRVLGDPLTSVIINTRKISKVTSAQDAGFTHLRVGFPRRRFLELEHHKVALPTAFDKLYFESPISKGQSKTDNKLHAAFIRGSTLTMGLEALFAEFMGVRDEALDYDISPESLEEDELAKFKEFLLEVRRNHLNRDGEQIDCSSPAGIHLTKSAISHFLLEECPDLLPASAPKTSYGNHASPTDILGGFKHPSGWVQERISGLLERKGELQEDDDLLERDSDSWLTLSPGDVAEMMGFNVLGGGDGDDGSDGNAVSDLLGKFSSFLQQTSDARGAVAPEAVSSTSTSKYHRVVVTDGESESAGSGTGDWEFGSEGSDEEEDSDVEDQETAAATIARTEVEIEEALRGSTADQDTIYNDGSKGLVEAHMAEIEDPLVDGPLRSLLASTK